MSIKLAFADFKCAGVDYGNTPDIIALNENSGVVNIKLVGELKVPWVEEHSLDGADFNDHKILACNPLEGLGRSGTPRPFNQAATTSQREAGTTFTSVTMKQCMFYVCSIASAASKGDENTEPWVTRA
ncbi:unnamed protein product [Penicillium bialowiezense]